MESQPRAWPVQSGTVPLLATGYSRRPETGHGPWEALRPGAIVIVGPDGDARSSANGRGGTGKTQLAVAFARRLWAAEALDLLVWLDAGSRDGIVAGYAQALADIRVAAPPDQPEAGAARFLTWLTETSRRWLVVLDGLADPGDVEALWPHGPNGEALVTTRLAGLSPRPATSGRVTRRAMPATPAPMPVSITVPAFSQREAMQYLTNRLNDDPYQAAGALDLATALECLPVGLDLSVAYLLDTGIDCRQYRLAYDQYRRQWADGIVGDPLTPSWMLAVDRARQFAPTDLPWPALKLAAVLGPDGIPGAVLTSAAACTYVTGRQVVTENDRASVRAAFGNLQRVGLVTIEPENEIRTVHMPAALQSSVRYVMGRPEVRRAVHVAADAVWDSWPDSGSPALLGQALRDCATSLRRCDDQALWQQGCHPVLVRLGQSLDDARMVETALAHWRDLAGRSAEYHGVRSQLTLQLRERLADAAMAAGHTEEAVGLREEVATAIDEIAGPAHPEAIAARASLVRAFRAAGRFAEAISLGRLVVSDSEKVFGPVDAQTQESLAELGSAYLDAGHSREAIEHFQRCTSRYAETLGVMQPNTVSARHQLAEAYRRSGAENQAIRLYQDALAQVENAVGAGHPDAVTAREGLAIAYYRAGRTGEAATTLERALAEWRRVPGRDPATTISARTNLAAVYCRGDRAKDAVPLHQSVLADLERIHGPAHPDSFRARRNLAGAYHAAKRLPEAVELGEATLADSEQTLGPGHRETLTTRANLAHAYHATGRLKRASAQFDRTLRDCEQALGLDDPLTGEVQALRKRYLAGRQGFAPILTQPGELASPADGAHQRAPASPQRRAVAPIGAQS